MNKVISKNFLKLLMGLFVICGILSYQNCASQGGGAAPFSIALGSTSPGALAISPISLASTSVQVNTAYTAAATLTGADLTGISCTWSLLSNGAPVGSNVVTPANSNSVCVASLTAPITAGSYNLSVIATNAGGEVVSTSTILMAQSGAVGPSYTLTLSSSSPAADVNEAITLTGTALANISGSYTVTVGNILGGAQTQLAGCSTSSTGTSLTFTCPVTFTSVGVQSLYINLSQGASVVQFCTAPSTNCLETAYSIDVESGSSGGGGGSVGPCGTRPCSL